MSKEFLINRRGCAGLPIESFVSVAKSVMEPYPEAHTFSDVISQWDFLFVFPEQEKHLSQIRAIISMGTAIDNLADEGPDFKSNGLTVTNREHYENTRERVLGIFDNNPEFLRNLAGFIYQVWAVEKHIREFDQIEKADQNKYRELVNAVWTRMYVSVGCFLEGFDTDPIGYRYAPDDTDHLPSYDELVGWPTLDCDQLYEEYKPYIDGSFLEGSSIDQIPEGYRSRLLYLMVMETSNIYDYYNRGRNHNNGTPALTEYSSVYYDEMEKMGVNTAVIRSIFIPLKMRLFLRNAYERNFNIETLHAMGDMS